MSVEQQSHIVSIPKFHPAGGVAYDPVVSSNPRVIAEQWVAKLEAVLASFSDALAPATGGLGAAFLQDCWWRDMLALSWDFRTISGLEDLNTYLKDSLPRSQIGHIRLRQEGKFQPTIKNQAPGVQWIESMFDFETKFGTGSGVFRLAQGKQGGEWRAYMMFTALQALRGFEESTHLNRPHGGNNSLTGGVINGNWQERRERQKEFLDSDPTVLVIGAGQAGLSVAARLQQLGLTCLIIDRNKRVGDNWRSRYRTLVTHDPVHYCHLPYLPFPSTWPMFFAKDKLADWLEAYASIMELNVWLRTTIERAEYADRTRTWSVKVQRSNGTVRTLHPHHVILCTGHSGEALTPSFPGQETFNGTIYHGSQHQDASLSGNVQGKNVVVVGSGNSGHDISQNYYENGANVTMLQRRGTYVIQAKTGLFMLHKGLYDEGGPPTEDADIYGQSMPIPVQFALNANLTERIAAAEKQNLDGLVKAGFELDFGPDRSGIYRKYVTRGGGYYIDVGCSQLIIDRKVGVQHSPGGIKEFQPNAVVLADGKTLAADIIVLATGYDNMRTMARRILGDQVADRCHDAWDLNGEGELNAMWRFSGHPGFWYNGGNLALCRIYSKLLALQIKAIEEDLYSQEL